MKTIKRKAPFYASPEKVFQYLDNLGVTGMHMTQSSAMMMGNKLHLEYLTQNHSGLGAKYRWTGRMLGIEMDFTVEVTKWNKGIEKIWETVGVSKMIIYSWYRMHLFVSTEQNTTVAELSISYRKPKGWFHKLISFLLADLYCKWCLRNMLFDTKIAIESERILI